MFYAFDISSLILTTNWEVSMVIPIFQIRHLWFREMKPFAQGHTEIDLNCALSILPHCLSAVWESEEKAVLVHQLLTISWSGNLRHERLLFKMESEGLGLLHSWCDLWTWTTHTHNFPLAIWDRMLGMYISVPYSPCATWFHLWNAKAVLTKQQRKQRSFNILQWENWLGIWGKNRFFSVYLLFYLSLSTPSW